MSNSVTPKPYDSKNSKVIELYKTLKEKTKDEDTYLDDQNEKEVDWKITDTDKDIQGLDINNNTIISSVALSVGILAVPLYILVKACTTKLCPKSQIPELNTEAQKKINELEAETLKLNEEIINIRKNFIEKHNQRIEKLNAEMQKLTKALDKTERKVGELMNDESKIKREFSHMIEKCQDQ